MKKNFFKQPTVKKSIFVFLFFIFFSLTLIAIRWSRLPPQVPLYYSLPWGEQRLAAPWELTLLPTLSLSVFTVNLLSAYFIVRKDNLLVKILLYFGLFVVGLFSYTLVKIIFLVS